VTPTSFHFILAPLHPVTSHVFVTVKADEVAHAKTFGVVAQLHSLLNQPVLTTAVRTAQSP